MFAAKVGIETDLHESDSFYRVGRVVSPLSPRNGLQVVQQP